MNLSEVALKRTAAITNYNQWIYDNIKEYVGSRILEVGCGLGNLTRFFIDKELILAIDIKREYVVGLKKNIDCTDSNNLISLQHDIVSDNLRPLLGKQFDTAICLNVLEHIEDDQKAIKNIFQLLIPGGTLILLVPAFQFLYGTLDKELQHQRRYSKTELTGKIEKAGFRLKKHFYMNFIGILAWFIDSKVLKKKVIPEGHMGVYNRLVPFFKFLEMIITPKIGLSYICIANKPR